MALRSLALLVLVCGVTAASAESRPTGGPGVAKKGLRVSITAAESYAEGAAVNVHLAVENTSDKPIDIYQQMDRFTVEVAWPSPSAEGCNGPYTGTRSRAISFAQINRGQLAPTPSPLAPGKTFELDADLASWATAEVNGKKPLGAGALQAVVRYAKLRSKAAGFTVAGTPGARRCKTNPGWRFWGPGR